jgi:predicted RNA-binding protein with PIN domain
MFLIDGYNLLHALGILKGRVGPFGLQKARLALLGLLHSTYREDSPAVTVVFDAANAPPDTPEQDDYEGIRIRWARGGDSADDLIESLIRGSSAPKRLTVISDDHRIQQAARRRDCEVLPCAEYLDWLERHRRERRRPTTPEATKPDQITEDESRYWLDQFADIDDRGELTRLSDPVEWREADEMQQREGMKDRKHET